MAVVIPSGEVDLATVDALRRALRAEEANAMVVLDLRQVSFMDSSGLELLVEQMRRSGNGSFEFAVVRGPEQVQKLFRIVGLDEELVVLDEVPGAGHAQRDE